MFEHREKGSGGVEGCAFWTVSWLSPELAQGEKPGKERGSAAEISGHDDLAREHVMGTSHWPAAHICTFESALWSPGLLSCSNRGTCKRERGSKPLPQGVRKVIEEGFLSWSSVFSVGVTPALLREMHLERTKKHRSRFNDKELCPGESKHHEKRDYWSRVTGCFFKWYQMGDLGSYLMWQD